MPRRRILGKRMFCYRKDSLDPESNAGQGKGVIKTPKLPDGVEPEEDCIFGDHECNPTHIGILSLSGPYLNEDLDSVDYEYQQPESLSYSFICGDTIENNFIGSTPLVNDEPVTPPPDSMGHMKRYPQDCCLSEDSLHQLNPCKLERPEEETIIVSTTMSLMADDTPVASQANMQYHRRKRLEWKLDASIDEQKPFDGTNNYTIYDDIVEDLDETIDFSSQPNGISVFDDSTQSCCQYSEPNDVGMNGAIGNYINRTFLSLQQESFETEPRPPMISKNRINDFAESATMTDFNDFDDDFMSKKPNIRYGCLPICKRTPKRPSTRQPIY